MTTTIAHARPIAATNQRDRLGTVQDSPLARNTWNPADEAQHTARMIEASVELGATRRFSTTYVRPRVVAKPPIARPQLEPRATPRMRSPAIRNRNAPAAFTMEES